MLVFLLLFENRIQLAAWLQVAGRMHPMILHFPIALSILYVLYVLFLQNKLSPPGNAIQIGEWLLLLSAFTAATTAILGLFLSREEGYDAEALMWHKWGGVAVSLLLLLWYSFRNRLSATKAGTFTAAIISFAVIIFTGHQGAGITHGQNFCWPLSCRRKTTTGFTGRCRSIQRYGASYPGDKMHGMPQQ
jgi:uncharacterized membrane protein